MLLSHDIYNNILVCCIVWLGSYSVVSSSMSEQEVKCYMKNWPLQALHWNSQIETTRLHDTLTVGGTWATRFINVGLERQNPLSSTHSLLIMTAAANEEVRCEIRCHCAKSDRILYSRVSRRDKVLSVCLTRFAAFVSILLSCAALLLHAYQHKAAYNQVSLFVCVW